MIDDHKKKINRCELAQQMTTEERKKNVTVNEKHISPFKFCSPLFNF